MCTQNINIWMDLDFLMANCSVRKLSAMLISNWSWITAASAFIFPGKNLQGILMTSRALVSLEHTVITHCQGGWKRTNRKFPCGKMCFISSLFSCQSSGRRYNWSKLQEEMKAVTLSTLYPYTRPTLRPCNWDASPGCGPRAKKKGVPSTEVCRGRAVWVDPLTKAEHPSTGITAVLLSCHSLMSALHSCFLLMKWDFLCSICRCISKLSRGRITDFDDGNRGKSAPSFSPGVKWTHWVC